MAPPRKHDSDAILDAARGLVLDGGPRSASVAAIAKASGAPAGTLYHRFGNRDGVLAALWLRALARFQEGFLAAAGAHEDALEAAVAGAVSAVAFARAHPEDARVLIEVRLADLLDEGVTEELQAQIDRGNARLVEEIRRLARGTLGRAGAREIDAVVRAVADLPSAVVRRHTRAGMVPPRWLEDAVGRDVRALLGAQRTTR